MTKRIRIENADTAPYKVIVELWEKGAPNMPDVLVNTINLDHPTAMTGDGVFVTSTRYLMVKEAP